jgi:resuscitation-promoting factor RpfA
MINRTLSSSVLCALAFTFAAAPLLSNAQTPAAPADASSTNAAPAPTPAPAPAPADTTAASPSAPTERPTTYTMVTGDSLDSIAKKFDTSIHALAKLNKIPKDKYRKLRAGTVLQIPPAKPDPTAK